MSRTGFVGTGCPAPCREGGGIQIDAVHSRGGRPTKPGRKHHQRHEQPSQQPPRCRSRITKRMRLIGDKPKGRNRAITPPPPDGQPGSATDTALPVPHRRRNGRSPPRSGRGRSAAMAQNTDAGAGLGNFGHQVGVHEDGHPELGIQTQAIRSRSILIPIGSRPEVGSSRNSTAGPMQDGLRQTDALAHPLGKAANTLGEAR